MEEARKIQQQSVENITVSGDGNPVNLLTTTGNTTVDQSQNQYFNIFPSSVGGTLSRVPRQMPPLPSNYIERPAVYKAVKTLLLNRNPGNPGTLVVSAVYGLGGIGKSVLATALAHDPEIQAQFPDGILWSTLGQQPDLLALLNDWIQQLGDRDYKPTTINLASKHLRTLLYSTKILLVVDDVWNAEHVEPFRIGGHGCCLLVTTREAHIQDAQRYDMDVMTPEESLKLLLRKARCEQVTEAEQQQAATLARKVGYLPLALELAGAQVADGVTWEELLEDLEAEIARLESLDSLILDQVSAEENRKRLSLRASFNLSLKQLTLEGLNQFSWLGVLPEDVSITPSMAAKLWNITTKQAVLKLRILWSKSLLLSATSKNSGKLAYRMHDLMHDMAQRLLAGTPTPTDPEELPGLGLTLSAAHLSLLELYRAETQQGLWHTLADDGYIHRHLTWHLERAGQLDAIHQLLQEETSQGRNGWYEACDRLGQLAIFVSDVARALRLAEDLFGDSPSEGITLQIRYTLILSTLNSLASNIQPELMLLLVKQQIWTPVQAVAYAQQIVDEEIRAYTISVLVPYLPESLLPEILAIAYKLQLSSARAILLNELIPYFPEILHDALNATCQSFEFRIPDRLSAIVSHLPDALIPQALDAARSIVDEGERFRAFCHLIPRIPEILPEAFTTIRALKNESEQVYCLIKLIPHMPEILTEALAAARALKNERKRISALILLTPYLPELLPEVITTLNVTKNKSQVIRSLMRVIPDVPELLPEALNATRALESKFERVYYLINLVPFIPEILPEALAAARALKNKSERVSSLVELIPHLADFSEILPEILSDIRIVSDGFSHLYALGYLNSRLSNIPITNALKEALEAAYTLNHELVRAYAFCKLAPIFPEAVPEALNAVIATNVYGSRIHRLHYFDTLTPLLPSSLLSQALLFACSLDDNDGGSVLGILIPRLPNSLLPKALTTIRSNPKKLCYTRALCKLAAHLPNLLPEALSEAYALRDDECAIALAELLPHFPEMLSEVLNKARKLNDCPSRAYVLSKITFYFPEILSETLEIARSLQGESVFYTTSIRTSYASILCELASYFPELLSEALYAALLLKGTYDGASAIKELLPKLNPEMISPPVWHDIIHTLAYFRRENLLMMISDLSYTIATLGGDDALIGTAKAIRDIVRQWP